MEVVLLLVHSSEEITLGVEEVVTLEEEEAILMEVEVRTPEVEGAEWKEEAAQRMLLGERREEGVAWGC